MKGFVRTTSIGLAVFSAIFWSTVDALKQAISQLPIAPTGQTQIWLLSSAPLIVFGAICVVFCHWFAKKLLIKFENSPSKVF